MNTTVNNNPLKSAMFVSCETRFWSARARDTDARTTVEEEYETEGEVGEFLKKLLPSNSSYKDVRRIQKEAYDYFYENSLMISRRGRRLLPAESFTEFDKGALDILARFQKALDTFIADYPKLVIAERDRLKGLYKERDYPSSEFMRSRFAIFFDYAPIPTGGAFEFLRGSSVDVDRILKQQEEQLREQFDVAQKDLWTRAYSATKGLVEILSDPKTKLKDKSLTNVEQLLGVLRAMNFSKDARFESLTTRLAETLKGVSGETLRKDEAAADTTRMEVQAVMNAMNAFMAGGLNRTGSKLVSAMTQVEPQAKEQKVA